MRLPSLLNVATADRLQLLRAEIRSGMRVLEIGCAPGKILAYVASRLQSEVAGIDTSVQGLRCARRLFSALHLRSDLRCEDLHHTTFETSTFDLVHSAGFIEHFDDPREVVRHHVRLAKPGGVVLITIPNYSGMYGWFGDIFDRGYRKTHNLSIMNEDALVRIPDEEHRATAFRSGRFTLSTITLSNSLPSPLSTYLSACANTVGLLQPINVRYLNPTLVLRIVKGKPRSP